MTRPLRITYPGAFYHITARGSERKPIFLDDQDRLRFVKALKESVIRNQVLIYCYVLMNNHYHLMLETPQGNLSQFMHDLNTRYTVYFNLKHNRVGHLFQGRYKSILVEKESYLLELSRYIHLNPCRAGTVSSPKDYKWSSYQSLLNPSNKDDWLEKEWLTGYFGKQKKRASKAYQRFVEEGVEKTVESPLKRVYAQTILGNKKFIEEVGKYIKDFRDPSDDREIPAIKELLKKQTINMEGIIQQVALYYGLDVEKVTQKRKRDNVAKQIGIYLTRKYCDESLKKIGEYFGEISYTAVSNAVKRVKEKKKRNPKLAREITEIERKLSMKLSVK